MQQEGMDFPRIMIAALRGGSGKTILSIGIIAAWKKLGKFVAPFKKGPDYIDAGWLALAAGRPCYNLDTFLIPEELVYNSFLSRASEKTIAVIEGNRGLYDGIDLRGTTSTAELAKLLNAPIVLCLDCTKTTRTMAAVVLGCQRFDPDVSIKGVVLNRVAGSRHENILRQSIETYCGIKVLGAIPKLGQQNFPERHMGLIPTPEHSWANDSIAVASQMASQYLDLKALDRIARDADELQPQLSIQISDSIDQPSQTRAENLRPKIGIIRDSAFQFYYPENIETLVAAGAEIVFFSPLDTETIPPIDALYIGGGFPETHAEKLVENVTFKNELKTLAEEGLPIYAECGGLMYLGQELILEEKSYPMAGVIPVVYGFSKKPQGHGYTIVSVERPNPFFAVGTEFKGHEFHYSKLLEWSGDDQDLVFFMKRGTGIKNRRDGARYKNVLATYTHIHALGSPSWAQALVRNAIVYKKSK
jgi:cobyrinic acid a,c-diamide synthase